MQSTLREALDDAMLSKKGTRFYITSCTRLTVPRDMVMGSKRRKLKEGAADTSKASDS